MCQSCRQNRHMANEAVKAGSTRGDGEEEGGMMSDGPGGRKGVIWIYA